MHAKRFQYRRSALSSTGRAFPSIRKIAQFCGTECRRIFKYWSHATGLATVTRTGGANYIVDSTAADAQTDASIAYINIQTAHCDHDLTGQDLGSMTLTPAVYCFSGDATLNGVLTLDAGGDNRANFVFQVAGSLTTQPNANIQIINNGETCNVLWQVNQSVSLGAATNFVGGIITQGNANFDQGTTLNGKIMSRNGSVSINQSQIYNNFCPWW